MKWNRQIYLSTKLKKHIETLMVYSQNRGRKKRVRIDLPEEVKREGAERIEEKEKEVVVKWGVSDSKNGALLMTVQEEKQDGFAGFSMVGELNRGFKMASIWLYGGTWHYHTNTTIGSGSY